MEDDGTDCIQTPMTYRVALVRGKFLNQYEMQFFEPLVEQFALTGFASLTPFHSRYAFPIVQLPSPMDLPEFPYKMPILNRLFTDAQYLFGLEDRLRGFDIVHTAETYFHYTQQCLNARKKGYVKKVVATVLENIPFNNEGITGRKVFKLRAREELDHIIALTQKTKETLLLEGTDPRKITIISHFVDTDRFKPIKRQMKSKEITILFSGRLEKYKGVYEILFAAKKLLMDKDLKSIPLRFIFVGDGSEKSHVLALEQRLGIESFVIHQHVSYNEMPKVYNEADIFLAPSKATETWQEQYNTTLLEAQASGLPIVTTASGGIAENIGNAGILVQPADFVSLAEAIKKFILNSKLRSEYSRRARKRAETVHDAKIGANKLAQLYNSLLS